MKDRRWVTRQSEGEARALLHIVGLDPKLETPPRVPLQVEAGADAEARVVLLLTAHVGRRKSDSHASREGGVGMREFECKEGNGRHAQAHKDARPAGGIGGLGCGAKAMGRTKATHEAAKLAQALGARQDTVVGGRHPGAVVRSAKSAAPGIRLQPDPDPDGPPVGAPHSPRAYAA